MVINGRSMKQSRNRVQALQLNREPEKNSLFPGIPLQLLRHQSFIKTGVATASPYNPYRTSVTTPSAPDESSPALLRETGPNERILHLIKVAFRGSSRALQSRLRQHGVLYGHWTLLRILWQLDGMTQRQLSEQAGIMESTAFELGRAHAS